jgi:gamma-glutamyl:cysteine ligase YbdK (ATP-grasp superfamily)
MASKKKRGKQPKWERTEGGGWKAMLDNSVEEQLRRHRAADREARKAAGTLGQRTVGAGVHGGDDRTRNRRERHAWKQRVRQGGYDE